MGHGGRVTVGCAGQRWGASVKLSQVRGWYVMYVGGGIWEYGRGDVVYIYIFFLCSRGGWVGGKVCERVAGYCCRRDVCGGRPVWRAGWVGCIGRPRITGYILCREGEL